jgi:hypothetical protein
LDLQSKGASFLWSRSGRSSRETTAIEECLLFRRRVTAEGRVAMREAPEARDDVLVDVRISHRLIVERCAKLNGPRLIDKNPPSVRKEDGRKRAGLV